MKLAFNLFDGLNVALARPLRRGVRLLHCARLGAAEKPRDFVERALRGGEADPLKADLKVGLQGFQPFQ